MSEEFIEESAELAFESAREATDPEQRGKPEWVEWAALSTMLMAVFSAIGGLMAGKTGNEAIVERQEQIGSLVQLNRMDLEMEILLSRLVILKSGNQPPDQALLNRIADCSAAMSKFDREALAGVETSESFLLTHELFAVGTTVVSIAITLVGMAAIVRRKRIWYIAVALSFVGLIFIAWGVVKMLE